MSQFSADYVPSWESGAPAPNGDFESNVTFEATDSSASTTESAGPLVSTVETTGWSTDDVMIGLTAANVVLFLALVYLQYGGDA